MTQIVHIAVAGDRYPFILDFDAHTWSAGADFDESDFPLTVKVGDMRYELYSDHTFAEEEL
jgi:hypothetical protein